jgi:DNA-binding NarL/FixJ family response regulator
MIGLPALLADVIREIIAEEDDMEVVAEVRDSDALGDHAERAQADFVITGTGSARLDAVVHHLYAARPATRVLAVELEGRPSSLYELAPRVTTVGELSRERLITLIRGAG